MLVHIVFTSKTMFSEDHGQDETYRIAAYDSVVTIVEPEGSILDFKL